GVPFGRGRIAQLALPPAGHGGIGRGFRSEEVGAHGPEVPRGLLQCRAVVPGERAGVCRTRRREVTVDAGGEREEPVADLPGSAETCDVVQRRRLADNVADGTCPARGLCQVVTCAGDVARGDRGPRPGPLQVDLVTTRWKPQVLE